MQDKEYNKFGDKLIGDFKHKSKLTIDLCKINSRVAWITNDLNLKVRKYLTKNTQLQVQENRCLRR